MRQAKKLFVVLFFLSAASMTAIDFYLGDKAEFFNACELMRRTAAQPPSFPLFTGEQGFGDFSLLAAWIFFVLIHAVIAAVLYGPVKRLFER